MKIDNSILTVCTALPAGCASPRPRWSTRPRPTRRNTGSTWPNADALPSTAAAAGAFSADKEEDRIIRQCLRDRGYDVY